MVWIFLEESNSEINSENQSVIENINHKKNNNEESWDFKNLKFINLLKNNKYANGTKNFYKKNEIKEENKNKEEDEKKFLYKNIYIYNPKKKIITILKLIITIILKNLY